MKWSGMQLHAHYHTDYSQFVNHPVPLEETKQMTDYNYTLKTTGMFKVVIVANWKDVCLRNTSKSIHTILKYCQYYDFVDR